MKIIILGGSGYLGFALANYLSYFFKVTLCTRSVTRVKSLQKKCLIIKTNYSNFIQLKKTIKGHDVVIHCVGMSSTQLSKNNRGLDLKKKITQNIVTACNYHNIKKLIYFSTIQVYQNYENLKIINEKSKICNKANIYSKSHIEAEKIITSNDNKINYVIIRLASIFGFNVLQTIGEQSNTIINNICKKLVLNQKIQIKNPNLVRNFLPMSIFLKNIKKIINENQKNNIINIGYKTYSLFDLSSLISKCYKKITKNKVKYYLSKRKKNKKNIFKYESLFIKNVYKETVFTFEVKNMMNIYKEKYDKKI